MPIAIQSATYTEPVGIYRLIGDNDESQIASSYSSGFRKALEEIYSRSEFWQKKLDFAALQRKLDSTASSLMSRTGQEDEQPNDLVRQMTREVLRMLERSYLLPTHLGASAEGGIGMSFVAGDRRAVIELYNTGEIVAGTYAEAGSPGAWEIENLGLPMLDAINRIRVYLAE